ncbi:MAG: hypothetical protein ACR2GD_07690 [Pyrinomonadaceae bacterium]
MYNKELFEDYEITGWQISPKTYKFLGIAAALNLFAILILSQFNLLQTKACDSPYIGKVCEVLDVVSLGSTLAETDTGFTDKDYNPTKIEEGDITYIDVSGQEPPFTYPEGYFTVANPQNETAALPTTDFGGFPANGMTNNPPPLDLNTPQVLPTPNEKVAKQPLPDSPFDFGDAMKTPPLKTRVPNYKPLPAKRAPIKNTSPSKLPASLGAETAGNSNAANSNSSNTIAKNGNAANANNSNQTAAANDDQKDLFNQKPLKDFGDKWGDSILKKDVDINAPFTIEVIGKLDENGKIINAQMKTTPDSDPKMSEVAKEAIAAFIDSELLRTLYNAGGRDVKITFSQNKDNLQAIIQTQAKDESVAKSMYNFVNLAMGFVKMTKKDSDEAKLMEKTQLATAGKIFTINFLISNEEKTQLIEKSLRSLAEKKAQSNNATANSDVNSK